MRSHADAIGVGAQNGAEDRAQMVGVGSVASDPGRFEGAFDLAQPGPTPRRKARSFSRSRVDVEPAMELAGLEPATS